MEWLGRDPYNKTQKTEESHKNLEKNVPDSANALSWGCTDSFKEHKAQRRWNTAREGTVICDVGLG